MSHDQAVRALATSEGFPEWARYMALAALRNDPQDAAHIFSRLASLFKARADAILSEHMEEASRAGAA